MHIGVLYLMVVALSDFRMLIWPTAVDKTGKVEGFLNVVGFYKRLLPAGTIHRAYFVDALSLGEEEVHIIHI